MKKLATQIADARRAERKLEEAATNPHRAIPDIETIKILNGWRLSRTDKPGAKWMLWHPGDPAGLGRYYYARVIEIDANGLYAQELGADGPQYRALSCAKHEQVEGRPPGWTAEGRLIIGAAAHCKWCGELWERIEERAGGSHG